MLLVLLAALHDLRDAVSHALPSLFATFCLAASIVDHLLPSSLSFSSGGVLLLRICGWPWFPNFLFVDQVFVQLAQFLPLQLESRIPAESCVLLFCFSVASSLGL